MRAAAAPPGASDILRHSPTAGLLRPAYVIVRDRLTREIILCVRGTHSRPDMFTSLTGGCAGRCTLALLACARCLRTLVAACCTCYTLGADAVTELMLLLPLDRCCWRRRLLLQRRPAPPPGTVKPHHVVTADGVTLGYSHLGMLAAARWLLSRTRGDLIAALDDHPGFSLRIVGAWQRCKEWRLHPRGGCTRGTAVV